MSTLCVVPCGAAKIWAQDPEAGPTPAREVYVGPFAKKCRQYAERFYPSSWCVLSAKHGFLLPDDIVPEPYDLTFNDRSARHIATEALVDQAAAKGFGQYDRVVVLGGRAYRQLAAAVFAGRPIHAPLDGCAGIGHMMHRLKEALSKDEPL